MTTLDQIDKRLQRIESMLAQFTPKVETQQEPLDCVLQRIDEEGADPIDVLIEAGVIKTRRK